MFPKYTWSRMLERLQVIKTAQCPTVRLQGDTNYKKNNLKDVTQ